MAVYRTVQMEFWTDPKVIDDFTPEDKYFYLYLITNPHTNLIGCYEISLKQISDETGYTRETIEKLIDRFVNIHQVIKFSKTNKEILLLNWSKHNWTKSEKLDKPLLNLYEEVKTVEFKKFLAEIINKRDTVSIPYTYPMDTTVTVTVNNNINNNTNYIKEIIDYLNNICGTKYTYKNKSNNKHINARLEEGHTVDEFKRVVDIKYAEWHKDERMCKFLRPETLFGSKFESYLNQKGVTRVGSESEESERRTDGIGSGFTEEQLAEFRAIENAEDERLF